MANSASTCFLSIHYYAFIHWNKEQPTMAMDSLMIHTCYSTQKHNENHKKALSTEHSVNYI
jgi:hypothetical protein